MSLASYRTFYKGPDQFFSQPVVDDDGSVPHSMPVSLGQASDWVNRINDWKISGSLSFDAGSFGSVPDFDLGASPTKRLAFSGLTQDELTDLTINEYMIPSQELTFEMSLSQDEGDGDPLETVWFASFQLRPGAAPTRDTDEPGQYYPPYLLTITLNATVQDDMDRIYNITVTLTNGPGDSEGGDNSVVFQLDGIDQTLNAAFFISPAPDDPPDFAISGSVAIDPAQYWEFNGTYDPDTGDFV